ncbi:MAG: metalloregulator ArsR/SmtB family transcription factor [Patescibacteria group bacterium]
MKELEKPLKALANRRRLAILKYLKQNREASVGEIAGAIKLSFRATSKHLGILTATDILDKEQRSLTVHYRLATPLPRTARAIIHLV